jgi:hypothetical protein
VAAEHHDFTASAGLSARLTQAGIVNALRKGDRQRASIMLSNLQRTKEALTSEDFSHILEYCAEAPDPLVNPLPDTLFYRKHRVWHSHFD